MDKALEECGSVEKCIVVMRTGGCVDWKKGRDAWWHDEIVNI